MNILRWLWTYRWFVLATSALVMNGAYLRRGEPPPPRPATVGVSFTPGAGATVTSNAPLRWVFSEPMAGAEPLGRPAPAGPVAFTPAVPGLFCWVTPRQLEFRPAEPWPPCAALVARLDARLRGPDDRGVAPRVFAFQTPPLALLGAAVARQAADRRLTLRLEFNAPVAPLGLDKFVFLESPRGRPLAFEVLGQVASPVLLLQTAPVPEDHVQIGVRAGLQGVGGPLALPADASVRVACADRMGLVEMTPVSLSFEPGFVRCRLTKPPALDEAAAFVEIQPPVPFTVESSDCSWREEECRLMGNFEAGRAYTVILRAGLRASDGVTLTQDVRRSLYFPDRPAAVSLQAAGRYLSPRGRLLIPVASVNVRRLTVTAQGIHPNNLVPLALRQSSENRWFYGSPEKGISHPAGQREYPLPPAPNRNTVTEIGLRDLVGPEPSGAYWLTIAAEPGGTVEQLVVVTDTGLAVKRSPTDLLVWANSLRTLEPWTGAEVRVYSEENQELAAGRTDADGCAHFSLDPATNAPPFLVIARRGQDVSYLPLQDTAVETAVAAGDRAFLVAGCEACLFTDRGVYRPGETTHVKAIVRGPPAADAGGAPSCPPAFPVQLRVVRGDGTTRQTLAGMLDERGAAAFDLTWRDHDATGPYTLQLLTPGGETPLGTTRILLEDFAPPTLAVTIEADPSRVTPAAGVTFTAAARHLFGAPAAGQPAQAAVRFVPRPFRHPRWPDYVFDDAEKSFQPVAHKLGDARLDAAGRAVFRDALPAGWRPASALEAVLEVSVAENGGRTVSATTTRPTDCYPYYIGLRLPDAGGGCRAGQPLALRLAAVHPDGTPAAEAGPLQVALYQVGWSSVLRKNSSGAFAYQSERRLEPLHETTVVPAGGEAACTVTPARSGSLLLVVRDPVSGASASQSLYAGDPDQAWQAWSLETPDRVQLELDRPGYEAGTEAVLRIKAPFAGRALLTLERDRVLEHRVLVLEKNTAEVRLPVRPEYRPNIYCCVHLLRPVEPGATWSAHRAAGCVPLLVTHPAARLDLRARAPAEVRPGSVLELDFEARTADGRPAAAEITAAVVDEGICLLTGFLAPDPAAFFDAPRAPGVECFDLYSLLMPESDRRLAATAAAPGGDEDEPLRGRLSPIPAHRFKPLALWRDGLRCGPDGRATARIELPDFSGELRVMAVAVTPGAVGATQLAVRVSRPLHLFSSPPRFLAPGDRCRVPVQVFNRTGAARDLAVTFQAAGPLGLLPAAGAPAPAETRRLRLADGAATNLDFLLAAGAACGPAKLTVTAAAGDETATETTELAVRPTAAAITLAESGALPPRARAVLAPTNAWLAGTGRWRLRVSALPEVQLGAGLAYLLDYPYGCLEQTVSAAFPLLYLPDLAAGAIPGGLGREQVADRVQAGIERLLSMQLGSGGFGYWPQTAEEYEWGSVYATHFLREAAQAGYDVPADRLEQACRHLEDRLARSAAAAPELALRAYACTVLALAGRPAPGWLARLEEQRDAMDASARLLWAGALAASGHRAEAAALLRQLDDAPPADVPRAAGGNLASGVRQLALGLSLWLELDPDNPRVPRLAERLLAARRDGRWETTQENAFALLALGQYARRTESRRLPFTASARLPDGTARALDSRDAWQFELTNACAQGLVISNEGPGTLYYDWHAAGVPADGAAAACEHGVAVRCRLLDADGEPADGLPVRQGDLLVVEWTVRTAAETDHLVLEDLLPAGWEVENAHLAAARQIPWLQDRNSLPVRHVDVRDDRVVAFLGPLLGEGRFYYAVRVINAGDYAWPPVFACCMYDESLRAVHPRPRVRVAAAADGP